MCFIQLWNIDLVGDHIVFTRLLDSKQVTWQLIIITQQIVILNCHVIQLILQAASYSTFPMIIELMFKATWKQIVLLHLTKALF